METPTSIGIGFGLVAAAYGFICWGLRHAHKRGRQAEAGRDRPATREERWYALDEPMAIEKHRLEGPLN
jgi:hypothetical protein